MPSKYKNAVTGGAPGELLLHSARGRGNSEALYCFSREICVNVLKPCRYGDTYVDTIEQAHVCLNTSIKNTCLEVNAFHIPAQECCNSISEKKQKIKNKKMLVQYRKIKASMSVQRAKGCGVNKGIYL